MLKQESFWETEDTVPLMAMNRGYISKDKLDHAFERAKSWLKAFKEPLDIPDIVWPEPEQKPERIITKDVERTFTADEFRNRFSRTLTYLNHTFGDYHQGMAFLVSFLGLFLSDAEIISIATRLNYHKDFIPGYWKHEAVAFAMDAHVMDHLLSKYNPEVHAHLRRNSIMPGTYPQKWFIGLCVHVLPFVELVQFLERFFARGVRYLFQFALGFFKVLGPVMLRSDSPVELFGYLRLDPTVVSLEQNVYSSIIQASDEFDFPEIRSDEDLDRLRKSMYELHLGAKFEAVAAARNAAEEKAEEDDDFDFDDEDAEAEPGTECQICQNMVPDYWCFGCKKFICGLCHSREKDGHSSKDHKIVPAKNAPPEAFEVKSSDSDDEADKESESSSHKSNSTPSTPAKSTKSDSTPPTPSKSDTQTPTKDSTKPESAPSTPTQASSKPASTVSTPAKSAPTVSKSVPATPSNAKSVVSDSSTHKAQSATAPSTPDKKAV